MSQDHILCVLCEGNRKITDITCPLCHGRKTCPGDAAIGFRLGVTIANGAAPMSFVGAALRSLSESEVNNLVDSFGDVPLGYEAGGGLESAGEPWEKIQMALEMCDVIVDSGAKTMDEMVEALRGTLQAST